MSQTLDQIKSLIDARAAAVLEQSRATTEADLVLLLEREGHDHRTAQEAARTAVDRVRRREVHQLREENAWALARARVCVPESSAALRRVVARNRDRIVQLLEELRS